MGADEFAREMVDRDEERGIDRDPSERDAERAALRGRDSLGHVIRRTARTRGAARLIQDLPVPLAGKGRGFDQRPDMAERPGVAAGALRARATWRSYFIGGIAQRALPVNCRPGNARRSQTRASPWPRWVEIKCAWLMPSRPSRVFSPFLRSPGSKDRFATGLKASAGPKGGRAPACRSSRIATRWPW